MEPERLNSRFDPDAELEALLRAPTAPLADAGFSQRVLAALPSPHRESRIRPWLCAAAVGIGCWFVFSRDRPAPQVTGSVDELWRSLAGIGTVATDPWILCALVVTAVSLQCVRRTTA
jgi:hypothetical protein